jgi:hypothetical protein
MIATLLFVLATDVGPRIQTDTARTVCEYRYAFSRGIVPVYRALRVDEAGWVHAVDRFPLPGRAPHGPQRAEDAKSTPLLRLDPEQVNEMRKAVRDAEQGELRETRGQRGAPHGSTVYRCFRPGTGDAGSRLVMLREASDTSRSENASPAAYRLTQWLDSLRAFAAAVRNP